MARTKNPSAATRKAWITRKRNRALNAAAGAGAGTTQMGHDYRHDATEKELREGAVADIEHLGGGVGESYKATLVNGREGCFKPSELNGGWRAGIDGQGAEREQAAWEVAKLVGMEDMVAPVVIREMDVPGGGPAGYAPRRARGSLAEWQGGEQAKGVSPKLRYDGSEDHQRAAMFDYIIGNQDRHPGNWIVADGLQDDGSLKLIDHNLSFGTLPTLGRGQSFMVMLVRAEYNAKENKKPKADQRSYGAPMEGLKPPSAFAGPYVKNKAKILSALKTVGLPPDAVIQVGRRINEVAYTETWLRLYGG